MQPHQLSTDAELIETMRLNRQGQVLLLPYHLHRLTRSAAQLGFTLDTDAVLGSLAPYLHRYYSQAQRLRISLAQDGHLSLQCSPLTTTSQPVRLRLAPRPVHSSILHLTHKTTQRSHWSAGEHWLQRHPSYFDVIYYDKEGFVTEGGRSNIYVFHQNQWITPPSTQGLLAGVQRAELLVKGWVQEQPITLDQLRQAQRVRVSNALRGWLDAYLVHSPNSF